MPSLKVDNGDGTTLVVAPSAKQFIRVIGLDLTASAASTVSLLSDATVIWTTSAMDAAAAPRGIVLGISKDRTIDCANGKALKLGATGGATIKGSIEYVVLGIPDLASS